MTNATRSFQDLIATRSISPLPSLIDPISLREFKSRESVPFPDPLPIFLGCPVSSRDRHNPAPGRLKHAGEEVYVEGVVASVHATPKGVAFINLGEAYPHQIFTGFIPNLSAIADEAWLNGLKGRTVRIHGRINIYHAIPEIRITSKDQVVSE
jgi:hypothetical protein